MSWKFVFPKNVWSKKTEILGSKLMLGPKKYLNPEKFWFQKI